MKDIKEQIEDLKARLAALEAAVKEQPVRTVEEDGTIKYLLDGKLHREDGPAVEWVNGDKKWYLYGRLHREGGPAIEWADGDKSWYLNGKPHREDGPAIEYADGDKKWYLYGEKVTEADVLPPEEPTTPKPHQLNHNHCGMQVEGWDYDGKNRVQGTLSGIDNYNAAKHPYRITCDEPGHHIWTQHARLVTGIATDEFTAAGTVLVPGSIDDAYNGYQIYGNGLGHRWFAAKGYVISPNQPHLEGGE